MKKVLILGAGLVAKPLANYLFDNGFELTIANRTRSKAEDIIDGRKGTAVQWTTENEEMLDQMIEGHDIVISILPYTYHILIARKCIHFRKSLITTSYVSTDMKMLHQDAEKAGIIILNEIGADPGLDHMTAMMLIDEIHKRNGRILEFYSLCGALPAPEEIDNPFRYKFTWSPKGVLMAGNNNARFLKENHIIEISTENLFKNPLYVDFPEIGEMEVYPNRDSLKYIKLYRLNHLKTMYRGTFRYPGWCECMDALKELGMVSYEIRNFEGKTFKEIIAEQIGVYPKNVKEKVAERLKLNLDSPAISAMEWLGLFDNDAIQMKMGSTFELTTTMMQRKMMLPDHARDMVLLYHSFVVENQNGNKEVVRARLLNFGTENENSIARLVALPAAVAAKLIMEGKIKETGVRIPVTEAIYRPVMDKLNDIGISIHNEWDIPESEKLVWQSS